MNKANTKITATLDKKKSSEDGRKSRWGEKVSPVVMVTCSLLLLCSVVLLFCEFFTCLCYVTVVTIRYSAISYARLWVNVQFMQFIIRCCHREHIMVTFALCKYHESRQLVSLCACIPVCHCLNFGFQHFLTNFSYLHNFVLHHRIPFSPKSWSYCTLNIDQI